MTKTQDYELPRTTDAASSDVDTKAPGRASRTDALVGPTGTLPSGLVQRKPNKDGAEPTPLPDAQRSSLATSLGTDLSGVQLGGGEAMAAALNAQVQAVVGRHERHRSLAGATLSAVEAQVAHHAHVEAPAGATPMPKPKPPALDKPIQRRGEGSMPSGDVQSIAAQGISDGGSSLPHLETIQRAFGAHDVSGVTAHVGGNASAACDELGALAFATGNSVAFGQQPDLHTAAHEAAHIVQQRNGATPRGGVGDPGDSYEQHADAVADRVVRGESAEALLGAPSGGNAGTAVQLLYNTNAPTSSLDASVFTQEQNPKLFEFVDHMSVDTGALEAANQATTILRATMAMKKSAIDKALAADQASGAKLDPGLETAIVEYQKEAKLVTSGVDALGGLRQQLLGLGIEAGGIQDKKDVDTRKETATEVSAEENAKAEAEIRAAARKAEIVGDLSMDVIAATGKGFMNPEDAGASVVDGGIAAEKAGFHLINDALMEQQVDEAKETLKTKWDQIAKSINKDNAAAISAQLDGIATQIKGVGSQVGAKKDEINAHLVASWQLQKTILKSKSPVTALAPIQDYMRDVPVKAAALRAALAKARAIVNWDYWGVGNTATNQLAFTGKMSGKEAKAEIGQVQGWIVDAQLWFAGVKAETTTQEEFVNGPIMEPAESALMLIADLGGTGGKK